MIWFLDRTNGDDGADGKASVSAAFTGKTLNYVGGAYTIVDADLAAAVALGDVLYITATGAPAQAAWWTVSDIDDPIVSLEIYSGDWVETTRTDCVSSSGPVKTLAALIGLFSDGDTAYEVDDGALTELDLDLPVIELIAQCLQEALNAVTVVTTAIRESPVSAPPVDHDCVMTQGVRRRPEDPACNVDDWIQPFTLDLVTRASDESTTPSDQENNIFVAAVEAALIGSDAWHITGLIDKQLSGPDPLPEGAAYDGVRLTLDIYYRTALGDPYTGIGG